MTVPYNSSDPLISAFLNALSLGESGGVNQNNLYLGFGGVDLSGAPANQYGFPIWGGSYTSAGPTHAAGIFQFEPKTWQGLQSSGGYNFGTIEGQSAAAWALAQQQDPGLYGQLQAGNIGAIQTALKGTWTSITGSQFASALQGVGGQGAGPFPAAAGSGPPLDHSSAASLAPHQRASLRRALAHLLRGKRALDRAGVSSEGSPTRSAASGPQSLDQFLTRSQPPKTSGSMPGSPSSASSSSLSEFSPSSGPILQTRPNLPQSPQSQLERKAETMSKVSEYINAHTSFLNVFLPTLNAIVNELPLPPAIKAAFDTAYTLAPAVITTGAAALAELDGGHAQPAALALAGAFSGGASEATPADQVAPAVNAQGQPVPDPTPAQVAPPPAPIVPPPAPTPSGPAPLPTLVPQPTPAAPAPAPAVDPNAPPPNGPNLLPPVATVPDPGNKAASLDAGQLAQLAASLGYQLVGPGGQIIPPGP